MPPRRTHLRPVPGHRYELAVEERPVRAFSSVNVRFEDKEIFDMVQGHLSAERGKLLSQWDAFGIVLAEWLDHRAGDIPANLKRPGASSRRRSSGSRRAS